ncbi:MULTISPECIES: ROK family transcriptional regulator [Pseudothermotoga]|uniref:Regulatory protein ArsR n=1 Tax=Pseudothermotoga lettingae (strain ATCC BAA-301 / DSM 14385 / NBRC 107922 / TMO) TaxID=416591 RepID=A8F375_PSELT|nr:MULTISPECIES: ROK family protein [Pseudothermotoga]ABV32609.1 regulatory protein ArsR [Pseudothermotoga lettingae TMO]KUK21618.1 MAG: Regulatory protein ArsR [Pseudothermotoga lettingae]MDI3495240.1 hypothetical protein [Pseudothermotoga sp.]MDK2885132.1 hypothetical protein [Pseudothermotoga sp.]GLI48403.1 ArsR family transcriptional regulator [Pseudothermotoga lettingae TMO]
MLNHLHHQILSCLKKNGPMTAQGISEELSVNESTISRNLRYLLECGIVFVKDHLPAKSAGGRKPRLLCLNPEWLKLLGISVEQGEICWTISDFLGRALFFKRLITNIDRENFEQVVSKVLFENSFDVVTIAMPGLIKSSENFIVFSEALGIENYSLNGIYHGPFLLFNDANAAAACYLNFANNLVYLLLSIPYELSKPVGLGAGMVINGTIYEGSNGSAGELGEGVPVIRKTPFTVEDLEKNRNLLTEHENDLEAFIKHICDKVATAVNLIDPELFVLGGDFHLLGERVLSKVIDKIESQVTVKRVKKINWQLDMSGSKTVALGSVLAFLERFFYDYEFAKYVFESKGCVQNGKI